MDARTRAYLNELARALEYNDKSVAIGAAEQLCTCPKCMEAKANMGLSDCDKVLLARNVHNKILHPDSDYNNYVPSLDPTGKRRSF